MSGTYILLSLLIAVVSYMLGFERGTAAAARRITEIVKTDALLEVLFKSALDKTMGRKLP